MTSIIPTVGRKVWYFANDTQSEPMDATVIKVHSAGIEPTPFSPVNLLVIDPNTGSTIFRPYIGWHDADEGFPGEHFQWMPYQQAQQAKTASDAVAPAAAPFNIAAQASGVSVTGNTIETKTYADGTTATGLAGTALPDQSPAQQDAAAAGRAPDSSDQQQAANAQGQAEAQTQTVDTAAS